MKVVLGKNQVGRRTWDLSGRPVCVLTHAFITCLPKTRLDQAESSRKWCLSMAINVLKGKDRVNHF